MPEQKDGSVDPAYRKEEAMENSNAQPETSYVLFGACFSAVACASCLATVLRAGDTAHVPPQPRDAHAVCRHSAQGTAEPDGT